GGGGGAGGGGAGAAPRREVVDARARHRRAGEYRVHQTSPGLSRERRGKPVVGQPGLIENVVGQQRVVTLGEQVGQPGGESQVARPAWRVVSTTCALIVRSSHRDDRRREPV